MEDKQIRVETYGRPGRARGRVSSQRGAAGALEEGLVPDADRVAVGRREVGDLEVRSPEPGHAAAPPLPRHIPRRVTLHGNARRSDERLGRKAPLGWFPVPVFKETPD